ncbi:hypothetical protein NHX12_022207 [Muraenolepis orangiensis]|uniref:Leucine-rich repeat-containing protein 18 n=1 Tax=Muraenolepis orangiensis TaxID=630683 RepID=A0A9Q0ER34_9TELE|nr:hypothetical protein NHX12_022207 [Muraenolepis orangiensis]
MVVKHTTAKGRKVTLKMAQKALEGRRRLDLSNLGIATFPKCLLKIAAVDELDLSRNTLQKLPEDLGDLAGLSRLDLQSNKLEALPQAMGRLVGLTHLNLSNNRLRSPPLLPDSLGLLVRLQSLNLGLNRLDRLPPSTAALTGLQNLGLFDNLFTELPAFLTAASLCETCLHRHEQERDPLKRNTRRDVRGGAEDNRKRIYSGLTTPNSVAAANQDAWRRRR